MIYNFFIFGGSGNCLFALDREKGDESLLFGFLFTMVSFSNRIAPVLMKEHNFFVCSTSSYQLVFMEMPTSVKFVIICSKDSTRTNEYYKQVIRDLYRTVYVEYHVKNPVIEPHATSIDSDLFREKVVDFFTKM